MHPIRPPTETSFEMSRRGALKSLATAGLLAGGFSTPALAAPPADVSELNVRLLPVERDPRVRWEVKAGVVYDGPASDGRRLWTYDDRDGTLRDTTGAVVFRVEGTSRGTGRLLDAAGDLVATLTGTVARVVGTADEFWFRPSETSEDAGVLFDPAAFPGLVVGVSGTGGSGATRRRGDVVLCDVTVVRELAVLKLVVVAILVSFLPKRVAAEQDP